ncbi:hypothetical protein ACH5RR_014574 [Cinchona calisaya]|uniref:CID domain-containing protein n=1 Tax=Cinchona calisaya TaxID=153742 RepID=A0ABD3A6V5_9GENT
MSSTFNPQILVEKLAKLNISQQSIETLSHWCIFHMNKAKQVVETWDRQFHCSLREQRLAYLYLANDILQNSRRKGSEFVGEFWKVLPEALRDVIESGDESGRNAAVRLVSIWEDRKVFGSRGQILKEEFVGRQVDNGNRNGKQTGLKLRHAAGNAVDRIVSSYQLICSSQLDEDSVVNKCMDAINSIQKVDKEIGGDSRSGPLDRSGIVDELKGQEAILRDCIEQLASIESSRANLVTYLREALQEQEYKLDQVRDQLQAAHVHSEQAGSICRQLLSCDNNEQPRAEQDRKENHLSKGPHDFVSGSKDQSAPVMYTRQVSFAETSSHMEDTKSAAAAVAAKLTASSSSAQMLTFVLSSLASEGVIGNPIKESSCDFPSEKRPKLENNHPSYVPSQNPETFQPNIPVVSQDGTSNEQPPPPSSPPPLPPLPPMQPYPVPQYMSSAGAVSSGAFGYGVIQQQPGVALPGYSPAFLVNGVAPFTAPPANTYQSYPTEGGFYSQPSSLPMAPVTRQ